MKPSARSGTPKSTVYPAVPSRQAGFYHGGRVGITKVHGAVKADWALDARISRDGSAPDRSASPAATIDPSLGYLRSGHLGSPSLLYPRSGHLGCGHTGYGSPRAAMRDARSAVPCFSVNLSDPRYFSVSKMLCLRTIAFPRPGTTGKAARISGSQIPPMATAGSNTCRNNWATQ
jgi:hypothetical protein